jgi:hypothetical protein
MEDVIQKAFVIQALKPRRKPVRRAAKKPRG